MQTFIFGHKNPDTDSVCSAISFSYLLNIEGKNTVPKVLGHLNQESKFALNYFNIKEPDYLNNTKVQIKHIKYNKNVLAHEEDSIFKVFNFLQKNNLTAIPLVDSNKKLVGFVTLKEIAKYLIAGDKKLVDTTYTNIIDCLDGAEILKFDEEIKGNILVASFQSKTFQEEVILTHDDILIVGDRYKIIDYAIEAGVKLIIITGNHDIDSELLEKAKINKVNIISSINPSFETTSKVILSNKIKMININSQPITINVKDYRTDFIALSTKEGHTNYPVINNKNECLGLLKVTSMDDYEKQKVIMVDHNTFSQSALGIEEAEIVEIIDHHNLGAIGTNAPINFRSMPVGCTCTIIYGLYKERNIDIPENIAGIMLSAILSDTMIFKSPTTTSLDIQAAKDLAQIAKVNIDEYGYKMFKAASSIKGIPVVDLIMQDFKSYNVGNTQIGISQVMTMDFNEIENNIDEYVNKLDELTTSSYLCTVLFITDVYKNGSYVIYNRSASEVVKDAFNLSEIQEGTYLDNLVSRKKQMLPALLEVIQKQV